MTNAAQAYVKRRRLAILLAVASVSFLAAGIVFDIYLETFFRPALSREDGKGTLVYAAAEVGEDRPYCYVRELSDRLELGPRQKLQGVCLAGIGDRLVYERRISGLEGGGVDLEQDWDVADAVPGPEPGEIWCFGVREREILVRRVAGNDVEPEQTVGFAGGEVRALRAFVLEDGTPAVSWMEEEKSVVRVATGKDAFLHRESFELGRSWYYTPVASDGRILLIYHHRSDRTLGSLILRVLCCASCGKPAPPKVLKMPDPIWLGRRITGLHAIRWRGGVLVAITRTTSLQVAPLTADGREDGALVSLELQPFLHKVAGYLWPALMLFFSFSLVFLGFTLLRERRRFLLERLRPILIDTGARYADLLQRAMAQILDLAILIPAWMLLTEMLGFIPEEPGFSLADPGWWSILLFWMSLMFVYHFLQEWAWGQTVGKRFVGIRVARPDGTRAGFVRILVRNLVRLVDGNLFLSVVGFAFLLLSPRRQRLGDHVAGTVVQDLTAPENEPDPSQEMANPFRMIREKIREEQRKREEERERGEHEEEESKK